MYMYSSTFHNNFSISQSIFLQSLWDHENRPTSPFFFCHLNFIDKLKRTIHVRNKAGDCANAIPKTLVDDLKSTIPETRTGSLTIIIPESNTSKHINNVN